MPGRPPACHPARTWTSCGSSISTSRTSSTDPQLLSRRRAAQRGARRRLARATNDWQIAEWLDKEPRLRASIAFPTRTPTRRAEIDRVADHPGFVQCVDAPHQRAAGQAEVLADLRGRRATACRSASTSAAGRATRSRLRLALVLHRGPHRRWPGYQTQITSLHRSRASSSASRI